MANLGMLGALGGLGEGLIHKAAEDRKDERAAIDEAREKRIADLKNLRDTAAASTLATAKVTDAETKATADKAAATALGENRLAVAEIGAASRDKTKWQIDSKPIMQKTADGGFEEVMERTLFDPDTGSGYTPEGDKWWLIGTPQRAEGATASKEDIATLMRNRLDPTFRARFESHYGYLPKSYVQGLVRE